MFKDGNLSVNPSSLVVLRRYFDATNETIPDKGGLWSKSSVNSVLKMNKGTEK